MNIRIAIALALTTAAVGCHTTPTPLSATTDRVFAAAPEAPAAEVCTVVRRGNAGNVRDTRIAAHFPDRNYGGISSTFAGNVNGGARQALLAFDLPALPEGAVITSAKVRLHKWVCGGNGVSAHRVTSPWNEDNVTWNSFAGAYDSEAVSALPVGTNGFTTFDVTGLAKAWADGSVANHGIVLVQDNNNTSFSTSEVSDPAQRPTLEVCWSTRS
jgi:hypothetical protein